MLRSPATVYRYSTLGNAGGPSRNPRRLILYVVIVFACSSLLYAISLKSRTLPAPPINEEVEEEEFYVPDVPVYKRRHVAIASDVPYHFDVYLSAAGTIREVLGSEGDVRVFARTPFSHGFQDIIDSTHLIEGKVESPNSFIQSMRSHSPNGAEVIDLVVLGTCEADIIRWSDELLAVWDARPEDQKFTIACIVHASRDNRWHPQLLQWAARGSIRLLPIAQHVGRDIRSTFQEVEDKSDRKAYSSLYEYVPIDVHVPVIQLPEYTQRPDHKAPSRVVIQGNLEIIRRDYPNIFADLIISLKEDPELWGYRVLEEGQEAYERLPASEALLEPFELHLIGEGKLEIPPQLKNIVTIHAGTRYTEFYSLMQSMDIVLPAFVEKTYYDFKASSTVAMAVQCNVPILASRRMQKAYKYIDDDRVSITRPQALREISAIGVLRRSSLPSTSIDDLDLEDILEKSLVPGYNSEKFKQDVKEMASRGWKRSTEGFEIVKQGLWARNRDVVRRILNDLPGEI